MLDLSRVDRFQRRHRALAVAVAAARKFGEDRGSNLGAVVTYYTFFSLFPLLLVFLTVLGYVLHGDPSALTSVKSTVLARFPGIGPTIVGGHLKGSGLALVVGIVICLYAGLGVTGSMGAALNRIWDVPRHEQPNFLRSRLRGLATLAVIGILFLAGSAASGIVGGGLSGPVVTVLGVVVSLALNLALFLITFRVLCAAAPPWRKLLPGAVLAALVWEALQLVGGLYIHHVAHADSAYGVFALVLGILAWLHLGSQATVYAAELNVVIERRLWPRALTG